MKYAQNLSQFYHENKKDVKSLLSKYSKNFVWSTYDREELEQGFYFMLLRRGVIDNFDASAVTNVDKVFTSYMCTILKNFCKEERRRLRDVRKNSGKHVTEVETDAGFRVCIFEAARFSWLPGSRAGAVRYSSEGGHQFLTDMGGETYEEKVQAFCTALETDRSLDQDDKEEILKIVQATSAGVTPSDVARSMECRPSKITLIRKLAEAKYRGYRKTGHV